MKNLKKRRLKLNLSQMELAKLSGIGRYNIGLCENNQRILMKGEKEAINSAFKKQEERLAEIKNEKE